MASKRPRVLGLLLAMIGFAASVLGTAALAAPGVPDEAQQAGRDAASFPAADEDYFQAMDNGLPLTPDEVKGRNMWLVWTGGNDRFWDRLTHDTFGAFDLLKTISSHPKLKNRRSNRWNYLGLTNEPCFDEATGPDPKHFGLWLDQRRADCPADPFANDAKYPGVAIGARGKNLPVGSYYGEPTGILGLRLFPNPAFDEAAAKNWDAERFYNDPDYYNSKDLVRPYRVGMSCGFCHVGPSPIAPPDDPENPKWENVNATVGSQYFWIDRIFAWDADPTNYMYQLVHTQRPGTLDTSLVSTDYINNPRTMNAIYNLGPRLDQAKRWGAETLAGGELNNKQFNDYVADGPLTELFKAPNTVVLAARAEGRRRFGGCPRCAEPGLSQYRPLQRGVAAALQPDRRRQADHADRDRRGAGEVQLLAGDRGADAAHRRSTSSRPDGPTSWPTRRAAPSIWPTDAAVLERGKTVFAERCARCHSSKAPVPAEGLDPGGCSGPNYLQCWNKYWAWTKTDDYKAKMKEIVLAPDFLDGNYLSTEFRVPVTLLQTNACSPLATNAIGGNIWDNFSSQTYKEPALGRHGHGPPSDHRRGQRVPDAGRRPRLHPPAVADQPVVDRTLPAQQHAWAVRPEPVGRGAAGLVPGQHRAAALAREAGEGPGPRRQGAGLDRPHHGAQLPRPSRPASSPNCW